MTLEEARTDLMLAQADVSYRPKDDSIDMAIEALEILEFAKRNLQFAVEHTEGETKDHYQRALNLLIKENKE